MAQDLTIRLLGRPKLSEDSQAGFHTLVRRYVAQGPRASKAGVEDPSNPLFLEVGTADEEFTDYKLVSQSIEPAQGTVDRAYLSRTFVDLRERWVNESVSQTPDLFKLNRKYVVLRGQNDTYGYSASAWAKHPSNAVSKTNSEDPWDYIPAPVSLGHPEQNSVTLANSADSGLTNTPYVSIGGTAEPFSDYLTNNVSLGNMGTWLPGKASVQMAAPGVDVWDVEWVTHGNPYWTFGTTSQRGGGRSQAMTIVDFDHLGLKLSSVGASGSSGSNAVQTKTYNFFVVADELPDSVAQVAGGSGTSGGGSSPSVKLSFKIRGYEGGTASFSQYIRNAVWTINTTESLSFPSLSGGTQVVGQKDSNILKFEEGPFAWTSGGMTSMSPDGLPLYQGEPIAHIGGQITWTGTQLSVYTSGSSSTYVSNIVSTKISPIFNYGDTKIWKVQITYVG